jgi:hypothetical protein
MPDCIILFRYRIGSGIVSLSQSGTRLTECRTVRHSGSQHCSSSIAVVSIAVVIIAVVSIAVVSTALVSIAVVSFAVVSIAVVSIAVRVSTEINFVGISVGIPIEISFDFRRN